MGVDGVRPANPQIPRIPMAPALAPVRVEVATEAMMAGVEVEDMGMEDMGMVEDITGAINLLASRCRAAYRSEMMGRAVAASLT